MQHSREGKLILLPAGNVAEVRIKGTDDGTIKLNLQLTDQNGQPVLASYLNVPVSTTTIGKIDATDNRHLLMLDDDGDGTTDRTVQPNESSNETQKADDSSISRFFSLFGNLGVGTFILLAVFFIVGVIVGIVLKKRG